MPERIAARPRLLAALALVSAWALFFSAQIFTDVVPYLRDNVLTYLPLRHFIHAQLSEGKFPEWYPYEALGVPLAGQLAVGLFHPATYLLSWMDYARAVKWNLLLAFLVALAGAYRWARALGAPRPAAVTAAFAFGFGGYALGTSSTLPYTMSLAALTWVGWALSGLVRRARPDYAAWLGIAWALVLLAGDPQSLLMSALLVPATLLHARAEARWRPALGWVAAAGALAIVISACDLLPGRVLFAESVRILGQPTADLSSFWSLPPLRLLELVTPGFLPDAVLEDTLARVLHAGPGVFCTTVFAGAATVALALHGARERRNVGWLVLALLALWLALGEAGGLLPLAQRVVLPLARMRYPEKYLAFFWVALVPLVSAGMVRMLAGGPRRWLPLAVGAAAVAVLAMLAPQLAEARSGNAAWAGVLGDAWRSGLLVSAGVLLALTAVTLAPVGARWRQLAVPALVLAELMHGNGEHLPMLPRALLDEPPQLGELRPSFSGEPPPRLLSEVPYPRETATNPEALSATKRTLAALYPDTAGIYGVASLGPRLGGFSLRYARLVGAGNEEARRYSAWVDACWALAPRPGGEGNAWGSLPCLGRAWLSGSVSARTPGEVLAWLRRSKPGGSEVAWEDGPSIPAPESGSVQWVRWTPTVLELKVEAPRRAALVVADELTPGWSATVDGAAVPLFRTLLALRGLEVPEGQHLVRLEYHTPLLGLGLSLTAFGLGACALLMVMGLRRRNRVTSGTGG